MTAVRGRAAAVAAVVGAFLGPPARAQTTATLGMSVSVIEYEGFLASGAATISPALRFDAPTFSVGGQGSWTVFESGNSIVQGTAAAGWLLPSTGQWRLELAGATGISKYADTPAGGHLLARARLHFLSDRNGVWAGTAAGIVDDGTTDHPAELEVGAWLSHRRLVLLGTLTGTAVGGDHHLDLLGAARWTGDRVELESRVGLRPWTDSEGRIGEAVTGVFAELSALVSLGSRIAFALTAGSDPADPVRRVLAARYLTAGLRFAFTPPEAAPPPAVAGASLTAVRARIAAVRSTGDAPAIAFEEAGDVRTIRVHAAGARSVELMADFTDWQPVALARVDPGTWETRMAVEPGVHRVNVRIDGGDWVVPDGARAEAGEFGGAVGVVVVR